MNFAKYHALGNDYIVIQPSDATATMTEPVIQRICHRHYGVGSDGILFGPGPDDKDEFHLRIFNPDGSEAEKSGNGLRIFARYLWDRGYVEEHAPFKVHVKGGTVTCIVKDGGSMVRVDMGRVTFASDRVPHVGPSREIIKEPLEVGGAQIAYTAVSVGNPNCVILRDNVETEFVNKIGPLMERHERFPERTNVQFVQVLDRGTIYAEIWERGAEYTLASGTGATAAASVCRKLGLVGDAITVKMPGGKLAITFDNDFFATLEGPVTKICRGSIDPEVFSWKV